MSKQLHLCKYLLYIIWDITKIFPLFEVIISLSFISLAYRKKKKERFTKDLQRNLLQSTQW